MGGVQNLKEAANGISKRKKQIHKRNQQIKNLKRVLNICTVHFQLLGTGQASIYSNSEMLEIIKMEVSK